MKDAESQLQICINEIDRWYKNNRLKINADKTNVMIISSRATGIHNELNVKLNDTKLKQVNSARYLGVNIQSESEKMSHHFEVVLFEVWTVNHGFHDMSW